MEQTARLYNCLHCQQQVCICSKCDSGNIYCSNNCAKQARTLSLRSAGARYQKTWQGRRHHAARQKRYRERLKEKVTHQGSQQVAVTSDLISNNKKPTAQQITPKYDCCHKCKWPISSFLRNDFLHRSSIRLKRNKGVIAAGP